MTHDLIVIGSGSAAFAAGIQARRLGATVALVERGTLGGTCVNVGCVPSKALLAAAEAAASARASRFTGIDTQLRAVDLRALVADKDALVGDLRKAKYQEVADAHGIDLLPGTARFVDERTLAIDSEKVPIRAVLIATGAHPHIPALPGLDRVDFLTSTTAMALDALPERLVVIGAGFVGAEQAQLFAHLGSRVTLIGPLMAGADPDLRALLEASLQQEGISRCGTRAIRVEQGPDGVVVHCQDGTSAVGDRVLVATGRHPNTADLQLDLAGIQVDPHGHVMIDDAMRTTNPDVYAAGDVSTGPQFVYVAAAMGRAAAHNAMTGEQTTVDYTGLPHVAFTNPQLAWSGLTEQQAHDAGLAVETRTLDLAQVPRAIVNRDTRGAIKIIAAADTNQLLGVHVLADHGGELLHAATIAIRAGWTVEQLADTWAPYLTMTEGLKLAAQSFTSDVSTMSCCA